MENALKLDNDINKNSVFCDMGASNDVFNNTEGTTNLKECDQFVKVGYGNRVKVEYIRDRHVIIQQRDGTQTRIVLKDVIIVESFWCNLFSVNKRLQEGRITNEGTTISITMGNNTISFDLKI